MKKILSFVFVTAILGACFVSCNDETYEDTIYDEETSSDFVKTVEATIENFVYDGLDTRTGISGVADEKQFVWLETDTIGIFPNVGFQVAFPMANGAGSQTAIFDGSGWGLKASASYSAYYPLIGQFHLDKSKIPMNMTAQVQVGNCNSDHISAYDYMMAMDATADENGGVLSFEFSHLVGIMHLFLQVPVGTYKTLILETSGCFVTEALLNLADGKFKSKKTSAIQVLNLDKVSVTDGELLEVYLAILPTDLTGKTLYAKLYNDEGICYTATLEGKNYEAGTFYNIGKIVEKDVLNTGLPIVLINTPDNADITSKVEWMKNASITILNTDGSIDYSDESLQIRGRGNTSWSYPKKPYALKLDSKAEILGMPKHKRWVLLANWMDRTLMRNDIAFHISNLTGLEWTPRGKFVEVVLNGTHIGNYYLCEQIKVDKNRVNITEMSTTDLEGDAITGGYLMELDYYFDEVNKFKSATEKLPYMFKDPDEDVLQLAQLSYFENYINTLEKKLYSDDWLTTREYADYIDLNSFVDWWLVHELMMNGEPNWPKSSYMHKDRLGKLKAGPVWDFDYSTLVPSMTKSWTIKNSIYYDRLFFDSQFVALVKERWANHKSGFQSVPDYIRSVASKIKASNEINYEMWPLSAHSAGTVNGDKDLSYDDAINRLIEAYNAKLSWLDTEINKLQ